MLEMRINQMKNQAENIKDELMNSFFDLNSFQMDLRYETSLFLLTLVEYLDKRFYIYYYHYIFFHQH